MSSNLKAIWGSDYDLWHDKIYKRPCCPECNEPIGEFDDDYRCYACGKVVNVDDKDMKDWFGERSGTKTEYGDCEIHTGTDNNGHEFTIGCGSKGTYKTVYVRDKITLEWRLAYGGCEKCGLRFIV